MNIKTQRATIETSVYTKDIQQARITYVINFNVQPNNVNKLFQESFVKHWDRPAVSDFHGETFSYEDVANHIAQLH